VISTPCYAPSLDGVDRGLDVRRVQSGSFSLAMASTCFMLIFPTCSCSARRCLGDARLTLDEDGDRRGLGDERVRAVGVDRDHHGDDQTVVLLRLALNALQKS